MGPDVPYTRQLLAMIDGLEGRRDSALERIAALDVARLDHHHLFSRHRGGFTPQSSPDSSRAGLVFKGAAGTGGFGIAAGGAALALEGPFLTTGFDALLTVTRTRRTPRGAAADATYVGVEAGLVIMSVQLGAGVAQRTAGTPGPKRTIFTWSVDVQIPVGW